MSTWGLQNSPDPRTVGEFELSWESKPFMGECEVDKETSLVTDLEVKEGRNTWTTTLRLCSGHAKQWDEIYTGKCRKGEGL